MRYYSPFRVAIPLYRPGSPRVTHPSAAKMHCCIFARLACVKHAASVRPEPGSNSHVLILSDTSRILLSCFITSYWFIWFSLKKLSVLYISILPRTSSHCSIFKDHSRLTGGIYYISTLISFRQLFFRFFLLFLQLFAPMILSREQATLALYTISPALKNRSNKKWHIP